MRKVISIILAMATLSSLLLLSSCRSSNAGPVAKGTVSTTSGDTLTNDTLTVGVDDSYPPMEYKDEDTGDTIGFDVDLATEVANRLGKKVKFVSTAWDGIFQAVKTDKFDCIISSVSMTTDRLSPDSGLIFTKAYIANSQMIVVKPGDNSIKKPADLTGKDVGCQVNTTANDSATYLADKEGVKFNLKTYNEVIQPFLDMKAGRLNAIIVDEVVGQYYIGQDPKSYKAAAAKLTNEPIGVCLKQGKETLRDEIQTAMDNMTKDGTMKKLSEKWFKTDLTSNIDTKLQELE